MHRLLSLSAVFVLALFNGQAATSPDRPRLVVLSDFYQDPDDLQSMIRLLVYANEIEIEGLLATSLTHGDGSVFAHLFHYTLADYAKVFPNLRLHERPGFPYPSPDALARLVHAGMPVVRFKGGGRPGFPVPYPVGGYDSRRCTPAEDWIGAGRDSPASEHIIRVVDRDDPRPVWIAVWGGPMDLAQALWKVRATRSAEALARFVGKIRYYQVSWQDTGAVWLWDNFPQLFRIQSRNAAHGIYRASPPELRTAAWVETNITSGHGPLAATYPAANAYGKTAVNIKEGDSPSFLHLLPPGLSDPEQPAWGGWGGRFNLLEPGTKRHVEARDRHPSSSNPGAEESWTVGRWTPAMANDFAARLDWCVRPYSAANHQPVAHLEGDISRRVLQRSVKSGAAVTLSAAGSSDPDGNTLGYRWWHYAEAGTFQGELRLQNSTTSAVSLVAPAVDTPQTAHLILEVTDDGEPRLTSYRRVILTFSPR